MSINKTLPQCDCINSCGDDDRVEQGAAQPCSTYPKMLASQADHEAVRNLSYAMMSKLQDSRSKGRSGWNDKTQCSAEHLSQLLRKHVEKGDPVDVANFCAFLSARGEGIAPQATPIASAVPGGWQELAARVMDALADAQDRTNAKYPEHVKCYPNWETKPRYLRWLAEMFRTGKPIGNGAGQSDVLAALCATPEASAPVVLPEPVVIATSKRESPTKGSVDFTWGIDALKEEGEHKLYTEPQLRALLVGVSAPAAQAEKPQEVKP